MARLKVPEIVQGVPVWDFVFQASINRINREEDWVTITPFPDYVIVEGKWVEFERSDMIGNIEEEKDRDLVWTQIPSWIQNGAIKEHTHDKIAIE